MAEREDYQRVEDTDPERCQGNNAFGQCKLRACRGTVYCQMHAGFGQVSAERKEIRNYRLNQFQQRMEHFADSSKVKCLKEEIGILRMVLEGIINQCRNDVDLEIRSGKIADLVVKVEKLVSTCQRMEQQTGMLLDKSAALKIADNIVEIIGKFLAPDVLNDVALKILEVVVNENKNLNLIET